MNIIDVHARIKRNPLTREYQIDELLSDMKHNSIKERWISCFDGESMQEQNDTVVMISKKYSQLKPCIMLNPRLDSSKLEIARISEKITIKMVEFDSVDSCYYPESQWFNIIPILEQCREKGIIVKIYSGSTYRGAPDSWRNYFEKFKDLKFIIEHMGAGDYQYGTIDLVKEFPNLYLETSVACEKPALKRALREIGVEKLLFGSHYPDYITELEILKFKDYDLTEKELECIFEKNATKLLY